MKRFILLVFVLISFYYSGNGQTIGNGQLHIILHEAVNDGVDVSSIQNNNVEILTNVTNELFTLDIRNLNNNQLATISSTANWSSTNVTLTNNNADATITLSNPNLANVPTTLVAIVSIHTNGTKSEWDLSVTGVGANHSLMDASFPSINIIGDGGQFLTPRFSGQTFDNPANDGIDYIGRYPRGNGTNMQFMAYYGAGSNIYFGFHDPGAAIKTLIARNESGGVKVECQIPIPNKTLAENDWNFPGHFEFDLYNGDWYEAALLYREWATNHADYWPENTPERLTRLAEIGKIGIWFNDIGYYQGNPRTSQSIQNGTQKCIDYLPNIPIATHLYTWFGTPHDDNYPIIFPPIAGLDNSMITLQNNGAMVMPYFNGFLYDSDLPNFSTVGQPNAASASSNSADYFSQNYNNSNGESQHFAIMCPTTTTWQDIIVDAAERMTEADMHAPGIYLDQISAASAQQCMNPAHNHTLGGGTIWRDGYKAMLHSVHANIPADRYVTVEGACDYLLDEVEGVLVDPWDRPNIVPAFPAVYAGHVVLFGTSVGTNYDDDAFYSQLSQSFSFGIQPGRLTVWLIDENNANSQAVAKPFARTLGTMRYKLRDFMSFGEMKYPPSVTPINPATIPTITSDWDEAPPNQWNDHVRMVTIPALQTSLWQKADSIAFVFNNASRDDNLEFNFNINGSELGLTGDLIIREVTENSDGSFAIINNTTTQNTTLEPLEIKAFIIKAATPLPTEMISFTGYKRNQSVALKWETASEINFEGFNVERSKDEFNWTPIGYVESKDNSLAQNSYQYLDSTPMQGVNYYRLKELDKDGNYKYSNIISVRFEHNSIIIYPNPTKGQLFVKNSDGKIDKTMIYNQLGELVFSSSTTNKTLDISYLPKGVYTIMIQANSKIFKQLVILE